MIKSTRDRFVEIDNILESYTKHNYIPTLTMKPTDEKGGLFEKLVQGINTYKTLSLQCWLRIKQLD